MCPSVQVESSLHHVLIFFLFCAMNSRRKSGQGGARQHASRPEASPLDFVIRPQSKIDPEQIRARAKQVVQDQRRLKMNKKLQQLKAPKKKNLQASKLSVEGRGMIKYL
jgi:transcription factor SPN1